MQELNQSSHVTLPEYTPPPAAPNKPPATPSTPANWGCRDDGGGAREYATERSERLATFWRMVEADHLANTPPAVKEPSVARVGAWPHSNGVGHCHVHDAGYGKGNAGLTDDAAFCAPQTLSATDLSFSRDCGAVALPVAELSGMPPARASPVAPSPAELMSISHATMAFSSPAADPSARVSVSPPRVSQSRTPNSMRERHNAILHEVKRLCDMASAAQLAGHHTEEASRGLEQHYQGDLGRTKSALTAAEEECRYLRTVVEGLRSQLQLAQLEGKANRSNLAVEAVATRLSVSGDGSGRLGLRATDREHEVRGGSSLWDVPGPLDPPSVGLVVGSRCNGSERAPRDGRGMAERVAITARGASRDAVPAGTPYPGQETQSNLIAACSLRWLSSLCDGLTMIASPPHRERSQRVGATGSSDALRSRRGESRLLSPAPTAEESDDEGASNDREGGSGRTGSCATPSSVLGAVSARAARLSTLTQQLERFVEPQELSEQGLEAVARQALNKELVHDSAKVLCNVAAELVDDLVDTLGHGATALSDSLREGVAWPEPARVSGRSHIRHSCWSPTETPRAASRGASGSDGKTNHERRFTHDEKEGSVSQYIEQLQQSKADAFVREERLLKHIHNVEAANRQLALQRTQLEEENVLLLAQVKVLSDHADASGRSRRATNSRRHSKGSELRQEGAGDGEPMRDALPTALTSQQCHSLDTASAALAAANGAPDEIRSRAREATGAVLREVSKSMDKEQLKQELQTLESNYHHLFMENDSLVRYVAKMEKQLLQLRQERQEATETVDALRETVSRYEGVLELLSRHGLHSPNSLIS